MKTCISFILSFVLMLSSNSLVLSKPNNKILNDTVNCRILTKEEAIKQISKVDHISKKEATKKIDMLHTKDSIFKNYHEYSTTVKLGKNYMVEVGSICQMDSKSGHLEFENIISSWSSSTDTKNYSWNIFHLSNQILNDGQLRLFSRGCIDDPIYINIPSTDITKKEGSTFHFRKVKTIDKTISLPWWK